MFFSSSIEPSLQGGLSCPVPQPLSFTEGKLMSMKAKVDFAHTEIRRAQVLRASMCGWRVSTWALMPSGLSYMLVMPHTTSVTLHKLLNVPAPFWHQLNGSDENNNTCLIKLCEDETFQCLEPSLALSKCSTSLGFFFTC